MCLCVRERRTREEKEIIIFYFLTHYIINLTFPTVTLLSQHKGKEVGIKTWGNEKKERKRQEERGVKAAGISGMIRGYETATAVHNPQHVLLQTLHWCPSRVPQCGDPRLHQDHFHSTSLTADAPLMPSRSHTMRDPHSHQDHFHSTIHFCCAWCPELQSRPSSPFCVHFALHRQICIHNS